MAIWGPPSPKRQKLSAGSSSNSKSVWIRCHLSDSPYPLAIQDAKRAHNMLQMANIYIMYTGDLCCVIESHLKSSFSIRNAFGMREKRWQMRSVLVFHFGFYHNTHWHTLTFAYVVHGSDWESCLPIPHPSFSQWLVPNPCQLNYAL